MILCVYVCVYIYLFILCIHVFASRVLTAAHSLLPIEIPRGS